MSGLVAIGFSAGMRLRERQNWLGGEVSWKWYVVIIGFDLWVHRALHKVVGQEYVM